MSGETLHISLQNLLKLSTQLPDFDNLKELFEADLEQIKQQSDCSLQPPEIYSYLQEALSLECCNLCQEIYNEAVNCRTESGFRFEYSTWDFLVKHISAQKFVSFTFAACSVWQLDPLSSINRQLSFNCAKMYLTLLTIPGAKRCGAFEEDVVIQSFKIFEILSCFKQIEYEKRFRSHERSQIQLVLVTFMDDLCSFLKHVALNEYKDVKKALVRVLKSVLLHHHQHGYENIYSFNLTQKSYESLQTLCLPIHGDVRESIYLVFCATSTFYGAKHVHPPSRKVSFSTPEVTLYGETIIEFFFHLLKTSSTETSSVLTTFIQSILTNPDENLKNEEYSYLLDIAVKYEVEIYKNTNTSLLPWLQTCCDSKEIIQRCNAVEFLSKILLIDTDIGFSLFPVDQMPREVEILKILFDKILDVNNGVKQKALNGLIKAFNGGNKKVTEILKTAFDPSPEEKYKEVCHEIRGLIEKLFHLLQHNPLAHIRRAVILLMEILATRNQDIIDCDEFKTVIMELPDDSTILVRKQSLVILNSLLEKFPNHTGLIELWCSCFLILMKDSDAKIVELAMNSLKTNVFDNIKSYEDTTTETDKMPWKLLRSILKLGNRNVLKNVVDDWTKNKTLNAKHLFIIESHIYTSNSTEAWLLLSLIAKKMKSKNPDLVINAFTDSIQHDMYNSPITSHLILEVINCWIADFSQPALKTAYLILFDLLKSGSSSPTLITFIYDVCHSIKTFAKSNNEWIHELNTVAKGYILEHQETYLNIEYTDKRYLNYLLLYSDSSVQLPRGPEYEVMHLLIKFIRSAAELKTLNSLSSESCEKICVTSIVITRLGVRDVEIASAIVPYFARILKKSIQKNITGDLIACLTDLCKKHTSCVEGSSMQEVTNKLKSHNHEIRSLALRSLRELVMQDYIKMRGRVLLNILTAIVDPYEHISNEASMVILTFVDEKNKHLLNTCFLESVFVYNGYLQYGGFELFPVSEFDNEPSALQGERKMQERHSLYQFFIDNIDNIPLFMLFKNINLIYERLKNKKFVKCSEGKDTLQDLLHIFTQICGVKAKLDLKSKEENPNEGENEKPAGINAVDTRPVRGAPTMASALVVIEKMVQIYPKFDNLSRQYDSSLGDGLDRLGEAIAFNFKSFIEFSEPQFWDRHKKPKNTPKKKQKTPSKRKARKDSSTSTVSQAESIMTEDNDDSSSILTEDS